MLQRVGIAIVDAVDQLVGLRAAASKQAVLGLKWPNDVLYDGRKLAGVLAQRSTSAPGLIVGFGVNVAWAPPDATRVNDFADCTAEQLLVEIIKAFDAQSGDSAVLAQIYRAYLLTLGHVVRVHLPGDSTFEGQAVDVDDEGRIIVISEMGVKRVFDVGDVVHLRPGTYDLNTASD
jgi:BirA family biotin operon repressor/biotin-[acetyl-CoA-carboxylase] ligase